MVRPRQNIGIFFSREDHELFSTLMATVVAIIFRRRHRFFVYLPFNKLRRIRVQL